jgi:hypothetical protein
MRPDTFGWISTRSLREIPVFDRVNPHRDSSGLVRGLGPLAAAAREDDERSKRDCDDRAARHDCTSAATP